MEPTVLKICVEGKALIPVELLVPFQGELKRLEREEFEKLKNVFTDLGFSFVFHVWPSDGKYYIIDGHQRLKALQMLKEHEGWQIPDLPAAIVHAADFKEAKRKVLAGASQYGKLTKRGLHEFLVENDIPFDEVVASFHFPEVEWGDFGKEFYPTGTDENDVANMDAPEGETPEMKHGSDEVKMVQLFFNAEYHKEFMEKISFLNPAYGTTNVTDTVMEAVREAYSARNKTT